MILMDEPASALAPVAKRKIVELIDQLEARYIINIVIHSLQQASRISQTVDFSLTGNLIEVAPTMEIFSRSQDQLARDACGRRSHWLATAGSAGSALADQHLSQTMRDK